MVQIDKAILATTTITPAKISTGEGEAGPFSQTLSIDEHLLIEVVYDLSYVNALSTGGVITPSFPTSNAQCGF